MDEPPHQQQEQQQRPQSRPRAGSTNAQPPTAPSADLFSSAPPAAAATNDHPRFVQAAALHNANETVNAMSAHAVTDSSQVSGGADATALAPDKQSGSALWVILGPVIAGVVVAAVIFGLVMARRRSRMRASSDPPKHRVKEKDKSSALDDDDLMVEMFEPPELLSSGNISGAFFNWRNATSPQPQQDNGGGSRRGSAQFSGRSTMLGLTTILEEGSNHDQQRIKKYHGNIRRPSNRANGSMSPLRIASPNPLRGPLALPGMRNLNMQAGDTPPLSPLISPTASPAPSDHTPGGGLPAAPGPIYLSAPVGRQKRKLTIPYTPQDVTRRRSLEGAW